MEAVQPVFGFLGFFIQWLRQKPWWNDGLTIVAALCVGAVGVWLSRATYVDAQDFIMQAIVQAQAFLGGAFLGHVASHNVGGVPKWSGPSQ